MIWALFLLLISTPALAAHDTEPVKDFRLPATALAQPWGHAVFKNDESFAVRIVTAECRVEGPLVVLPGQTLDIRRDGSICVSNVR